MENTTQFNHYIQSFNVNTNSWVAHYIYKRLKFFNNRLISQAFALFFLAMWHGFHSGYYVCFFFEFLVVYLEKDVSFSFSFLFAILIRFFQLQRTISKNPELERILQGTIISLLIHILLRVYTFVFMGWCLIPFVLLTYDKYWRAFGAVNYVGMFLYVPWPILYGPLLKKFIAKREPRQHEE